jgi:uncharacterized membrane protein
MRKFFLCFQSVFYIVAGINHFIEVAFYEKMIPGYLPWPLQLVSISGVAEIILGAMLLFRSTRKTACVFIVLMLIAFMPVHIYLIQLGMKTGGLPLFIAWVRLPIQVLFVYWAGFFYRHPDIGSYKRSF